MDNLVVIELPLTAAQVVAPGNIPNHSSRHRAQFINFCNSELQCSIKSEDISNT